jgi:hypothetical protein
VPKTVDVAANLLCINGGLTLLLSFFLLAAVSLVPLGLLLALAVMAVAAAQIRAGVLVRGLVPRARTAGIVLSALALVFQLPTSASSPVSFVFALALNGATLVLLYHRDTLRVFPTKGRLRL